MTREIHREPPGTGEFDWRLSLATIDRPGPFSAFDGYDRTLVLVRGAGVELDFGRGESTRLTAAGQLVSFDGAWPTRCTLIDGPSTDLNLIVSRARAHSSSRCARIATSERIQTASWDETFLCCISGSIQVVNAAGETEVLRAADTARCFQTDGVLACYSIEALAAIVFVAAVRRRTVPCGHAPSPPQN